jgi:hypothetical protein
MVTRFEISQVLMQNLDKRVRIVYTSGDVKQVVPISVDALGFVYDAEVGESFESFFAPFDNIEAVLPHGARTEAGPRETEA